MANVVINPHRFEGVFKWHNRILTKNLVPGTAVYGETLVVDEGMEYRTWDPHRSKLAAMILNGAKMLPVAHGSRVLYLGAATGTTASHVSDLVGLEGKVFSVEFSNRCFHDLIALCKQRQNMMPILDDARHPERYERFVGQVDVVYQDVSQDDQVEIFIQNVRTCLRPLGYGILMVKAQCIDVTAAPKTIFQDVKRVIRTNGLTVVESVDLKRYQKAHMAVLISN